MADQGHPTLAAREQLEKPAGILRYDRADLLRLQHGALCVYPQQDDWWSKHVEDLGPDVVEELQELLAVQETSHLRRRSKNSERRLRSKARWEALKAVSTSPLGSNQDRHEEGCSILDDSSFRINNENICKQRKGSRKYQSFYDEDLPEVDSFQPQAFAVEGEPDFESGEPEDGWEYLRRVKYEAARCPKVVVAEIEPAKLVSKQTPYMPELPEISECPLDLRPSKDWEKQFLGDFSILRMALSNICAPPIVERIPSLGNKVAWEMRCFGSTTSMDDEEPKELDTITTKDLRSERGNEDSAAQAKTHLLPLVDSTRNDSNGASIESRSEQVNDEKELLEPFIELVESQIEPLINTGVMESNYVIDLGLITDYVAICEHEELFNESMYLISGEPAEADDDNEVRKAVSSSAGAPHPEDLVGQHAETLNLRTANLTGMDDVEGSSFEIIGHFEQLIIGEPLADHSVDDGMRDSSFLAPPGYIENRGLTNSDFFSSTGADDANVAVAQTDLELFIGNEISSNPSCTRRYDDVEGSIQFKQLSSSFEEVDPEDDRSETAEFMTSLGGEAWALDEGAYGEFYSGIDSHVYSSNIGDPHVVQGEIEAKLPSVCDFDIPELDEDLPIADFTSSLIGLEIVRSGNILADELEKNVDAPGHSAEFRIDEPLEELFNKVFQLVGVLQLPFIHLLLRLDEVSRAALLRHHVSWLEKVDGLPTDRALWLIALSAVVDVPLDAHTSAAFRALLRHCSGVRALKQTRNDEELYLLNVIITVAGVFFGQAEAVLP